MSLIHDDLIGPDDAAATLGLEVFLLRELRDRRRAYAEFIPLAPAVTSIVISPDGWAQHGEFYLNYRLCDEAERAWLKLGILETEEALARYCRDFGPIETPDGIYDADDEGGLLYRSHAYRHHQWGDLPPWN